MTLFFVLKGSRYLQACASTTSCGAHRGSGRHGKGGMTAMANNSPRGGSGTRPDLTCLYWAQERCGGQIHTLAANQSHCSVGLPD